MKALFRVSLAVSALAIFFGVQERAAAATSCADLADLSLPQTEITMAERVPAGEFDPPGGGFARPFPVPEFCRVAGTVAPAIDFEVWLPVPEAWNGRFQAVGGGGFAGVISYGAMGTALRAGYVTASTDTGHDAGELAWLMDAQRMRDYGYRAIHEMTVKAKALLNDYYGRDAEYSYFNGCSTGGRQGLMEVQRFPDDYDGVISGAPVNNFTRLHMSQLWMAHAIYKVPGAELTRDDFAMIRDAVLKQCDAKDGVKDGILTDPRRCDFDPRTLQCEAGESEGCLSRPQVEALEDMYQGPRNPRTGAQIYPGLEPGGEGPQPGNPGWSMILNGGQPFMLAHELIRRGVFENPDYDWRNFDFDQDVEHADRKLGHVLNAVDPDLRDFTQDGGKLIIWHGWNDPGVMPQATVNYYESIVDFAYQTVGRDARETVAESARLFMLPGVGHCRGGLGPDQADFMAAITDWVEDGEAPDEIIAVKEQKGEVKMSRPLCPYPQYARYTGNGDTDAAENFECVAP